jgi:hypothetical protein
MMPTAAETADPGPTQPYFSAVARFYHRVIAQPVLFDKADWLE